MLDGVGRWNLCREARYFTTDRRRTKTRFSHPRLQISPYFAAPELQL